MAKRLLTAEEVADLLHVERNTVYRWMREGKLPSVKIGRLCRIEEAALEALLSAQNKEGDRELRASSPDDPFLELVGSGESGKRDISARHDDYLAERHRS